MNVLEMEEAESLVGTKRKANKKGDSRNGASATDDIITCVVRKNFLTYMIGVAAVAMVFLFVVSAKDATSSTGSESGANNGSGIADVVQKAPVAAPIAPREESSVQTASPEISHDDHDDHDDNDSNSAVKSPVTEPPITPAPIPAPTPLPTANIPLMPHATMPPRGPDINKYSKFSSFTPLEDPPLPNATVKKQLADQHDKWGFFDGEEDERPSDDFLSKYPNRDCPGDDMPDNAWQADAVFVNHYLNDADKLISRAMEAIFSEYGLGKEDVAPEELSKRFHQFHWIKIENITATTQAPDPFNGKRASKDIGGWTTSKSESGLIRRLLHAMMTSDTFTVVLGGHSAAAGEGNHFRQSYMMQFHQIMAPIFARLGVKLITRNVAMGGIGTIQHALASASIYGNEIDLLLWDSGMTEGGGGREADMFIRQALMGGNRVPVIWGRGFSFELLKMFHEEVGADIGTLGNAMAGIPEVTSEEHSDSLPWAVRNIKCTPETKDLCGRTKYCATCWEDGLEGLEGLVPQEKQREKPKGQVGWHPGWREHQLMGRNIAMAILQSLQSAVNLWTENVAGGPPLADEFWHVTEYYDDVQAKVKNMKDEMGKCNDFEGALPTRMCNIPMKGLTQYQPLADPVNGLISAHMKVRDGMTTPQCKQKNLFDGPAPHLRCWDLPEGATNVYGIVSGRRLMEADRSFPPNDFTATHEQLTAHSSTPSRMLDTEIIPGKGWERFGDFPGFCDGTYNSHCNRAGECILLGHQAARGSLIGNEFSGWLVVNLKDLQEGIIVLKLHTWYVPKENTITEGWTTVNNERHLRERNGISAESSFSHHERFRSLARSTDMTPQPDTMVFDYAIDGKITSLPKDEFIDKVKKLGRVVEVLTILDDPNFTSETRDVEIAIRMRGCGRDCTFGLSHVYWA